MPTWRDWKERPPSHNGYHRGRRPLGPREELDQIEAEIKRLSREVAKLQGPRRRWRDLPPEPGR
jgi:hypothetical protein